MGYSAYPIVSTELDSSEDLSWHALNYRTAATQHAEQMWKELEACVERIVQGRIRQYEEDRDDRY